MILKNSTDSEEIVEPTAKVPNNKILILTDENAISESRKYIKMAFISFFMPTIVMLLSVIIYTFVLTPSPQYIYRSPLGKIVSTDNPLSTTMHEGQIKSYISDSIKNIFTFNYASFRTDEDYKKLLEKKLSSSLPDYRDSISPLMTESALQSLLKQIMSSEFYINMHSEYRRVVVTGINPPSQIDSIGNFANDSGKLTKRYSGVFYLWSSGDNEREYRYIVKYTISAARLGSLERIRMAEPKNTYYEPYMLIEPNSEWIITAIDFKSERAR